MDLILDGLESWNSRLFSALSTDIIVHVKMILIAKKMGPWKNEKKPGYVGEKERLHLAPEISDADFVVTQDYTEMLQ